MTAASAPRVSIIVLGFASGDRLARCLDALRANVSDYLPHETLVLVNGPHMDWTPGLHDRAGDVRVSHSPVNLGFAGGCNWAARDARGEYLVFLNDDAIVRDSLWLRMLVRTADRHPDAGAVGSRIVAEDGSITEEGSVVWSDGRAEAVGRHGDPRRSEHDYVREVDFCSASSLLVRREAWRAVGGMDEAYFPAYFEDVDLGFRLRRAGYRVLYEPRSVVTHTEGSSTHDDYRTFLNERNRQRFRRHWWRELQAHVPCPGEHEDIPAAMARAVLRARGVRRRVLLVDDRLPDASLGSGFGRMRLAVEQLTPAFHVAFHATQRREGNRDLLRDEGVRVIDGDIEAHLRTPHVLYDAVIVSRPPNAERLLPLLRRWQPCARVVYDTEALWHRRLEREAALLDGDDAPAESARVQMEAILHRRLREEQPARLRHDLARAAEDMRTCELSNATASDHVVCISEDESKVLEQVVPRSRISVISPLAERIAPTVAPFADRRDLLLVAGWLAGPSSPNADGAVWFIDEVLPLITAAVPWVRLRITGGAPPERVAARRGPNVRLLGHVADVRSVYEAARVVVVPLRFGSGVKIKTAEALLHRVPVVATSVGAEGLDLLGSAALRPLDDPGALAADTVTLLTDAHAWRERVRAIDVLLERQRAMAPPRWDELVHQVVDRREPMPRTIVAV